MSRRRLLAGALGAAFLLPGCGAGLPHPDAAQLARARDRWPETTAAELDAGRGLYVARCSGCHALHRPSEYDAPAWDGFLDKMAARAKVSAPEKESIRRYLATAAAPGG